MARKNRIHLPSGHSANAAQRVGLRDATLNICYNLLQLCYIFVTANGASGNLWHLILATTFGVRAITGATS
jgi:hypothetical protein